MSKPVTRAPVRAAGIVRFPDPHARSRTSFAVVSDCRSTNDLGFVAKTGGDAIVVAGAPDAMRALRQWIGERGGVSHDRGAHVDVACDLAALERSRGEYVVKSLPMRASLE